MREGGFLREEGGCEGGGFRGGRVREGGFLRGCAGGEGGGERAEGGFDGGFGDIGVGEGFGGEFGGCSGGEGGFDVVGWGGEWMVSFGFRASGIWGGWWWVMLWRFVGGGGLGRSRARG